MKIYAAAAAAEALRETERGGQNRMEETQFTTKTNGAYNGCHHVGVLGYGNGQDPRTCPSSRCSLNPKLYPGMGMTQDG